MKMTDTEIVFRALCMWSNHIETGDVTLSAQDANNCGYKVKGLSSEQIEFISRLKELQRRALNEKVFERK